MLQISGDTGDRATCSDSGHEDVDLAFGVIEDFGTGGLEMDRGIGRVLELLWHEPAILSRKLFGFGDGPLHPIGTRCQNQIGTETSKHHAAFERHRFGHGQRE